MNSMHGTIEECQNVTADILHNEIVPKHQPVILRGLVSNWEIVKTANQSTSSLFDYLKSDIRPNREEVESYEADTSIAGRYFFAGSSEQYNFTRHYETFISALERIQKRVENRSEGVIAYTGAVDTSWHLKSFEKRNPLPFWNQPSNTKSNWNDQSKIIPRIWLGNPSTISTHYDELDNIACVVSGTRTFTLFPTEQIRNLYVSPFDLTIAGVPVSLVNVDNPDFNAHPRYKEALEKAYVAKLEPGDALYLPSLWWHNVKAEGDLCALVNYWWSAHPVRAESPMETLLHALYSLSHLKPAERKCWQEIFNFLVFKDHGEPMAHLPEHERGIFRDMTPEHLEVLKNGMLSRMGVEQKN